MVEGAERCVLILLSQCTCYGFAGELRGPSIWVLSTDLVDAIYDDRSRFHFGNRRQKKNRRDMMYFVLDAAAQASLLTTFNSFLV